MITLLMSAALSAIPAYPATAGSFCSGATANGVWAFVYSGYDIATNCNEVESALYDFSVAPLWGSESGFYWLNAANQVSVNCNGFYEYFTGYGGQPMQAAFDWAKYNNLSYCLFQAN